MNDTAASDRLILSFEHWEGPLDLLLALARARKIDLASIPILSLVEQYLAFIGEARALKLEIAAEYLVMAAWLAYLKSALLLPKEEQPDPDPEEVAGRLRWRLLRLDAMRNAADGLLSRDLLGRDVLRRGAAEGLREIRTSRWDASLYDLIAAYGALAARPRNRTWTPHDRGPVVSLEEALERLSQLLGHSMDWTELRQFLPETDDLRLRRSALASFFVASLELARLNKAEISQTEAFGSLMIRPKPADDET